MGSFENLNVSLFASLICGSGSLASALGWREIASKMRVLPGAMRRAFFFFGVLFAVCKTESAQICKEV